MNPSTSDVKQRHKRKGKRSPLHSSRGRIGTSTIKKKIDTAARRANKRVDKAATTGKGRFSNTRKIIKEILAPSSAIAIAGKAVKENVPKKKKIPTIGSKDTKLKVRPKGYKPPKINKPTGPKTEFESFMEKTQSKKYGGKINYRMGGGQVVDSSYD